MAVVRNLFKFEPLPGKEHSVADAIIPEFANLANTQLLSTGSDTVGALYSNASMESDRGAIKEYDIAAVWKPFKFDSLPGGGKTKTEPSDSRVCEVGEG